ncbi:MAG: phage tail protein, partial [Bordetella sp.]|nr:phage tail protein [Bordetella sp.]
ADLGARAGGFQSGVARSSEVNTPLRQTSFVASALAQYIVERSGLDVLDDGDVPALVAKLIAALAASPAFTGGPTAPTPEHEDNSQRLATTAFVQGALGSVVVPAGAMLLTFANAAPAGYLKANGLAVSRSTYAALFAAIGTSFGAGDGTTTFNLPDARGEFFRGFDDGRGVDIGRSWASWQKATVIAADGTGITSPATRSVMNGDDNVASLINRIGGDSISPSDYTSLVCAAATSTSAIGIDAQQNFGTRPRNLAPLVCIKF